MRTNRNRTLARTVAALAGASVLLTACGAGESRSAGSGGSAEEGSSGGSTTGLTDTTIKIGTHMPLTGVAAPGYSDIPTGTKAYFDYVNANGGVHGRQIEYVVRDDGYNPSNTSQVTNQLVLQDEVFAMMSGLGTPTHTAVLDFLNESSVPDLFVSSGALAWNQPEKYPNTFGWQPNYEVEGKIIGQYIAENFPDAKVGLYLQGDDFGRDGAKGAELYLKDQVVSRATYTPGNTDVGPQVAQLQADGADFVLGFNVPAYTALSQLVALRLNYKPKWFYSNVGSDVSLVGSLLDSFSKGEVKGGGLLNGIYTTKYLPTVEEPDNPWIQQFDEIWKEHGDAAKPLNNFRVYGMSQAYTLVAALQAAGPDVTRESIVQTIEDQGAELQGPWLAPFDYAADSHRGISGVQVVQVKGSATEKLSEILTTDSDDAPIEEAPGEPAKPDEDGIPNA